MNRRSQYVSDKIRDDPSGMEIGVVRALEILDFKREVLQRTRGFPGSRIPEKISRARFRLLCWILKDTVSVQSVRRGWTPVSFRYGFGMTDPKRGNNGVANNAKGECLTSCDDPRS